MTNETTEPEKWTGSPEAQALAASMGAAQSGMTALVTRCGQAMRRLPETEPISGAERAALIEDARIANEELPEILLAMAASVMIGIGSDEEHEGMPSLWRIAAQKDEKHSAARLEALAEEVFIIAHRRRDRQGGWA